NEKEIIDQVRAAQEKLDSLKTEAEQAQRIGDLTRASEITYGRIPGTQRELEEAKARLAEIQRDGAILKEEVTEEDIARVVSSWTGVPVSRLQEGEKQKLVHMEERLG